MDTWVKILHIFLPGHRPVVWMSTTPTSSVLSISVQTKEHNDDGIA